MRATGDPEGHAGSAKVVCISSTLDVSLGSILSQMEKGAIGGTLDRVGGHKHRAARVLGMGVKTLYRRLEAYRFPSDPCGLLPPSSLLYQNDPDCHIPSFALVTLTCLVCLSASDAVPSHA